MTPDFVNGIALSSSINQCYGQVLVIHSPGLSRFLSKMKLSSFCVKTIWSHVTHVI